MKQLRILALFVLSLFAISSCIEDEKPSKTALLTGKNWKLTSETIDPGINIEGTIITDFYQQYDDCDRDNLTKFDKNGSVAFDEGSSKCESNDPQTIPGSWAFNTDQTIISVTADGETHSYTIIELTKSTLKVKTTEKFNGLTYTLNSTYTAQ